MHGGYTIIDELTIFLLTSRMESTKEIQHRLETGRVVSSYS